MKYLCLSLAFFIACCNNLVLAQCQAGEDSVVIRIETDSYAYEGYWELVPGTNTCGTGTIHAGGNNSQVGCNGGGQQDATSGNGYPNNGTVNEGPFCLTSGNNYTIHFRDDWGDGGFRFTVLISGYPMYTFNGTGSNSTFTFNSHPPLSHDAAMMSVLTPAYLPAGQVLIKGKIKNYSLNVLTDAEIIYTIDGGSPVSHTFTGLSVQPFGEYSFTHPVAWNATPGTYNLSILTGSFNGVPDLNSSNDVMSRQVTVGPPVPNIIDQYLAAPPVFTLIADASDQVDEPRDLDFYPVLTENQLWILNTGTMNTGGSTVTIYNAGEPNQASVWKRDGNAWHFMLMPTGIAFSDNTNFGTSPGVLDANHGSGRFTGPTLWSGDTSVYAEPSGGNGSHLDMLHQSPYSMGIASETDNIFWVFDDYHHRIVRYDFQEDHGPGNDDHSDGLVRMYDDIVLSRINLDIPCHMILDKNSGWLYVVDGGNARVVRMDITTGSATSNFVPYAEPLAENSVYSGATWNEYITSGLSQPAGIDIIDDRMIVSDYSNGDIIIYDMSATTGSELGRIHTGAPGICGVRIGPDGKIWYVNALQHTVHRIDTTLSTGVKQNPLKSISSVYPNPTAGEYTIRIGGDAGIAYEVEISDSHGRKVSALSMNGNSEKKFEAGDLSAGVYFVSIRNESEKVVSRLVIAE